MAFRRRLNFASCARPPKAPSRVPHCAPRTRSWSEQPASRRPAQSTRPRKPSAIPGLPASPSKVSPLFRTWSCSARSGTPENGRRPICSTVHQKAYTSPILTILWRCGHQHFSSRRALARVSGKKPSTVFAEHHAGQGLGNADSRPNGWDFGEGGRSHRRSRIPGCVAAHPAHWRASPSYLPLRADWAVCAWALRGCARCQNPSAPI